MKRVLIVRGTVGWDVYDLRDALKSRGIVCEECSWSDVGNSRGPYDLTVLFGLEDREKNRAHQFAGAVRKAIGPRAKFLIVSRWNGLLMRQEHIRETYDAEYFARHSPFFHLVDKVLGMLEEAKTAP